jgi:hypothetical protein
MSIEPNTVFSIKSVNHYLKLIERHRFRKKLEGNNNELIFRGQSVDRPLLPKISRLILRTRSIPKTEELILAEFKRGILPLSEFKPENEWDLLALAQHHGLPTRLLDWTYNALIALWFAVEQPPIINKMGEYEDGVVWILVGDINDFHIDTQKTDPFSIPVTKIFRSSVISRRISSQSGIFTVHNITADGKISMLEEQPDFKEKLIKVPIPYKFFPKIRKQLSILGIHSAAVYPDMDGLCRHLQWRFSKQSDEYDS